MVVSNKKKAIIVWLLALLVAVLAAGGVWYVFNRSAGDGNQPDKTALQAELNSAIAMSMSGECAQAVNSFEALIPKTDSVPDIKAEARLRAGQCYASLQRYQDAANRFDEASKGYAALGDTTKQAQASALYEQAAANSLNQATSSQSDAPAENKTDAPANW